MHSSLTFHSVDCCFCCPPGPFSDSGKEPAVVVPAAKGADGDGDGDDEDADEEIVTGASVLARLFALGVVPLWLD